MRSQLAAWAVSIALCASGVACSEWQDRPNSAAEPKTRNASEWPVYGGTDSLQFSPLAQIDRSNVAKLEVA
jgi:glucose dehydrogenase